MRLVSTRLAAVAAAAMMSAAITGCSKAEKEPVPLVPVHLARVQRASLTAKVVVDAVLFPADQAMITPKITAPVARFLVKRGERVHKGQLLAQLENRDLNAAVEESGGSYKQAEAGYQTATKGTIPEDLQKAQLDLKQAKENLDAQSKVLESRKSLFAQGAMPRKDLDQAQVQFVQAQAQFEVAQKHLQSLQSVGHEASIHTAEGQLAAAKGHLAAAEAQLAYSEIRSPIDGVVTDRPAFAGETVASGTPLITVMDLSTIVAKAHIAQTEAATLKVGDTAQIHETASGHALAGKVSLVSPALDPNSTTVEIWVTAKNDAKAPLRPGSAATVEIEALTMKEALAVPVDAVVPVEDGKAVMTVGSDMVAHVAKVTTGVTDPEQKLIQITSDAAKEGTQVIVGEAYGLPDGTKVKLAEEEKPTTGEKDSDEKKGDEKKDADDKKDSGAKKEPE